MWKKASAGDSCDELSEIQRQLLIFERGMFPPKAITNIPPAMKCLCSSTTAWKANLASYVPLVIKVEGHFGGAENKGAKKKSSEAYFQKTYTL